MRASVLLLAVLAFPAVAQPAVRPGLWEYTMKMDMGGGMAPMQMQHKACMTPEQIARNEHVAPRQDNQKNDCKVSSQKIDASSVSFVMICTKPEAMRAEGRSVFRGDSFESDTKFTSDGQTFRQQTQARRVGDCAK